MCNKLIYRNYGVPRGGYADCDESVAFVAELVEPQLVAHCADVGVVRIAADRHLVGEMAWMQLTRFTECETAKHAGEYAVCCPASSTLVWNYNGYGSHRFFSLSQRTKDYLESTNENYGGLID
jgi:hypothetical protein